MFANFARRPIAQQLILIMLSAFVVVFSLLILVMQQKADGVAIEVSEQNLEHEVKLMAGMLDSTYDAVKLRGESEAQFFRKYIGGQPEIASGMVKTGEVDLPVVRLGGEVLNGNDRLLKSFRELTGSDSAFLMVRDGKVYRLATLLKDKEGKPMNGVPLPDGDPVAKALLAGQDYQGWLSAPESTISVRFAPSAIAKARCRWLFRCVFRWITNSSGFANSSVPSSPARRATPILRGRPMRRALANS